MCLHVTQTGNLFLLRSRIKLIQNQTTTWTKERFTDVSYTLWVYCVVDRSPWTNFINKKISSQISKTIFSLQSPQNFYYLYNNSSQRSYCELSVYSDNMNLYSLLSLDSIRSTSYTRHVCIRPAFCLRFACTRRLSNQTKSITTSCGFFLTISSSFFESGPSTFESRRTFVYDQ